jgi:hypothetical protein
MHLARLMNITENIWSPFLQPHILLRLRETQLRFQYHKELQKKARDRDKDEEFRSDQERIVYMRVENKLFQSIILRIMGFDSTGQTRTAASVPERRLSFIMEDAMTI